MAKITTIKLDEETKARLDKLKEHERETYEQVIKKILYILNMTRKNPMLGSRFLNNIDRAIKQKQAYTEKI